MHKQAVPYVQLTSDHAHNMHVHVPVSVHLPQTVVVESEGLSQTVTVKAYIRDFQE